MCLCVCVCLRERERVYAYFSECVCKGREWMSEALCGCVYECVRVVVKCIHLSIYSCIHSFIILIIYFIYFVYICPFLNAYLYFINFYVLSFSILSFILGKTLAFGLPVLDFLLRNWKEYSNRVSPVALIIAPTRELAMQISTGTYVH